MVIMAISSHFLLFQFENKIYQLAHLNYMYGEVK